MVKDLILTTQKNIKKYKIKKLEDIYKSKYPLVDFSNEMKVFDKKIKSFLRRKMYYHKNVINNTNQGKKIIRKLFLSIKKIQAIILMLVSTINQILLDLFVII